DLNLIALSDTAWQVIDPDGEYEAEEQAWSARLQTGEAPWASLEELRTHLDQLAAELGTTAPAVPPSVVAAVMIFLAAHPQGHDLGEALLTEALDDAFGSAPPAEVASW